MIQTTKTWPSYNIQNFTTKSVQRRGVGYAIGLIVVGVVLLIVAFTLLIYGEKRQRRGQRRQRRTKCCTKVRKWCAKEPSTDTQDENGIAIQRMDTPVAVPTFGPVETSVDSVPVATATGIRTMGTVDAMVTLPPATIGEMEAVPNAVGMPV